MPFSMTEVSRPVAVERAELTLAVDKRWVKVGDGVVFSGRLTQNGVGYGGQEVVLQYRRYLEEPWKELGRATTDLYGNFMLGHTFTYDEGCYDVEVRAYWSPDPTVVSASVYVGVAFPTRLSIEAPGTVTPGETFTVSGKLEYERSPGVWYGLPNETVTVYYNGTVFSSAMTDSYGNYSVQGSIPTPGSYTLKAVFEGSGAPMGLAPSFAVAVIPREWQAPDWAKALLDFTLAFSPFLAAGMTIAYDALQRTAREERWLKR